MKDLTVSYKRVGFVPFQDLSDLQDAGRENLVTKQIVWGNIDRIEVALGSYDNQPSLGQCLSNPNLQDIETLIPYIRLINSESDVKIYIMGIDWAKSGVSKSDFVDKLSEWINDSVVHRNWPDKPDITHHISIIKTEDRILVFTTRFFNGQIMLRADSEEESYDGIDEESLDSCKPDFNLVKNEKVTDFSNLPVYYDSVDSNRNYVATPYVQNVQSPVLATCPYNGYTYNPWTTPNYIRNVDSLKDIPNSILLNVLTHREVSEYCNMNKNVIHVLDENSRALLAERYKINIDSKIFFSERFVNHMENREFKPRWVNINGCDIIAFWEHVGRKGIVTTKKGRVAPIEKKMV